MTGPYDEIRGLRALVKQSQDAQDALLRVVNATLLFHSGGPWSPEKSREKERDGEVDEALSLLGERK